MRTGIADPSLVSAIDVARSMGSDPTSGLTRAEAADRLASAGPNRLRAAPDVPAWRKMLAQRRSSSYSGPSASA